jgi:hypothetical protein
VLGCIAHNDPQATITGLLQSQAMSKQTNDHKHQKICCVFTQAAAVAYNPKQYVRETSKLQATADCL